AEVRDLIRRERCRAGLTCIGLGQASGLAISEICSRSAAKIGFRRFVIERLAAVLNSPDLTRLANSDVYWDKIVELEELGPRTTYDLQIEADHSFVANNLIVHNSHAMSFALLVYDSAWLKCYEPAAFTCALLNSQPMGFYAPAQLVRDARMHGVQVRPVSVEESDWDCTLERREAAEGSEMPPGEPTMNAQPINTQPAIACTEGRRQPALRLGLRLVKS